MLFYSPASRRFNINLWNNAGGGKIATIQTVITPSSSFFVQYSSINFKLSDYPIVGDYIFFQIVDVIEGKETNGGAFISVVSKPAIKPTIEASKTLLCSETESSTITISSPEPDTKYLWSNRATTTSISVNGSGTYDVSAQSFVKTTSGDLEVCAAVKSESVKIDIFDFTATIKESGPINKCQGGPVTLSAGQEGDFTYTWNRNNAAAGSGSSFEVTETGNYTVTIAPNAVECPPKTSTAISVNFDAPIEDARITTPGDKTAICGAPEQPSLELTAMPANLTYSWTQDGTDLGMNTQKITVTKGGKYEVQLTRGGCTSVQMVEIADNNFDPDIAETPLQYCTDSPITLSAKADNTDLYDYTWKQGTANIGTNSPVLTLPAVAGVFKYSVEIVAKNSGCKEKTSKALTINSDAAIVNPTISPNPAIICDDKGLILTAQADSSAGIEYIWNASGKPEEDPSKFTVYEAGTYSVTFERGACKATETVKPTKDKLTVNVTRTVLSDTILLCTGDNSLPVELKAQSNLSTASITWFQSGKEAPDENSGNSYIPKETGNYYAVAKFNECTATSPEIIKTRLLPSFSATIFPESIAPFCEDKTVELEARSSQEGSISKLGYVWFQDGTQVKSASGNNGRLLETGKNIKYANNSLADQTEAEFAVMITVDGCKATSATRKVELKPSRPGIIVLDRNTLEATEALNNAYQWYFKNEITTPDDTLGYKAVTGATSRVLMGADSGSYFVRANRNGCGVKNSLAYAVGLMVSVNPAEAKEWKVYPNPAFRSVTLEQVSRGGKPARVELRNTGGQLLRQRLQSRPIESYPLDDLPPGVYFFEISQGNRIINKKIVKQ